MCLLDSLAENAQWLTVVDTLRYEVLHSWPRESVFLSTGGGGRGNIHYKFWG